MSVLQIPCFAYRLQHKTLRRSNGIFQSHSLSQSCGNRSRQNATRSVKSAATHALLPKDTLPPLHCRVDQSRQRINLSRSASRQVSAYCLLPPAD